MPTRTSLNQWVLRKEHFKKFLEAGGETFDAAGKFYILKLEERAGREHFFHFVYSLEVGEPTGDPVYSRLEKRVWEFGKNELANWLRNNHVPTLPANNQLAMWVKPIDFYDFGHVKESVIIIAEDTPLGRI